MPLILTEEQTLLQDAADGFLNERAPIAHLRKLRDSRDPEIRRMAQSVVDTQTREIAEMKAWAPTAPSVN